MAVSSQIRPTPLAGECVLTDWKRAGLLKPSVEKPVLASLDVRLILRKLGRLRPSERKRVQEALRVTLG
jgi:mRNA interferase MazF